MSFRTNLISAVKNYYKEGPNRRKAATTILQEKISNYFEHLKADIAKELQSGDIVKIDVQYIQEGKFVEIQIEEFKLWFIKTKSRKIEVWATLLYMREEIYLYPWKIDTLTKDVDLTDEVIEKYMKKVFNGYQLLNGEVDELFQ